MFSPCDQTNMSGSIGKEKDQATKMHGLTKAQPPAYALAACQRLRSGIVVSGEPPTWNRMSAAFAQGLKSVKPNAKLLYSVIGEGAYADAAGAKRNTEDQIAVGADVIFGQGDGASFGMLQACSTKKARDGGQFFRREVQFDPVACRTFAARFNWAKFVDSALQHYPCGHTTAPAPYGLEL